MRRLLDWTRFGPASRDYIDWVEGASPLPSTDKLADQKWNELPSGEASSTKVIVYVVLAAASLLLLSVVGLLLWRRRCRGVGKLGVASVISLSDLQDPERNVELLSSIRRGRQAFPSSASDPEVADGVFLMVYLSPPYEETLTQLARAASITSSRGAGPPGRSSSRAVEETQKDQNHQTQALIQTQDKNQDENQAQTQALIQTHDQNKALMQSQALTQDNTNETLDQNQTQTHDKTYDQAQAQIHPPQAQTQPQE